MGYPQLMDMLHRNLRKRGFSQRPQLTSSQQFHFQRPFLLNDILPNSNPQIGRTVRQRFPPRPRHFDASDPLSGMLDMGVGIVGGMMLGDMVGDMLGGGGGFFGGGGDLFGGGGLFGGDGFFGGGDGG